MLRTTKVKSGPQCDIRQACDADAGAAEGLVAEAGLPLGGLREHWSDFSVAVSPAGEIVGVAGLEIYGRAALLRSVVVAPAWRGRDMARDLVHACCARAAGRSVRELYLLTDSAEAYFRRLGFEPVSRAAVPAQVKRSIEFKTPRCASAACMRLALVG